MTEREDCILKRLGWKKDMKSFESFLYETLKNNPDQWNAHLLGSFYWRYFGRQKDAFNCARLSYDLSPERFRSTVILSAATILLRSNSLDCATKLLNQILKLEPENAFARYQLANIKSISGDQTGAINEFNHVLHISPNFVEAKLRRSAVICHDNIEKALNSQHE